MARAQGDTLDAVVLVCGHHPALHAAGAAAAVRMDPPSEGVVFERVDVISLDIAAAGIGMWLSGSCQPSGTCSAVQAAVLVVRGRQVSERQVSHADAALSVTLHAAIHVADALPCRWQR